jgi:putative chitobiose transport system substrate-binding protein
MMRSRWGWKRLGLLALMGVLLSWLISCGSPSSNSSINADGKQEVEFWTMQLQPDFTDYFTELIASFEAENADIVVRWVDVPWADMQSKILTAVSAGTAPDVVNLNPDFASQLASKNAWLPLDDRLSAADKATYLPKIWNASSLAGQSFGLPWYLTTRVTLYNQDLFEAAGIATPRPPMRNWPR